MAQGLVTEWRVHCLVGHVGLLINQSVKPGDGALAALDGQDAFAPAASSLFTIRVWPMSAAA